MLLEYNISIVGEAAVERMFSSLEHRAATHNARMRRMFGGASAPGATGAVPGASRRGGGLDPELAAERKASAEKIRGENYRHNLRLRHLRDEERARKSADAKAEREMIRGDNYRHNLRLRHLRDEDRARKSADAKAERERLSAARTIAREEKASATRLMSTAGRSVGGSLRTIGGTAAMGVGLIGGMAAGSAVREELSLGRRYRDLAINSRDPGQEFTVNPGDIGKAVSAESLRTGSSRSEVLQGIENYVTKTGDLKSAIDNMQNFSDFAIAFKSNAGDIATAAATLEQQFGLKSKAEVSSAMTALGVQGRKGAFELTDMASFMPEMSSAAKRFGLTGLEGARTAGGLAQLSVKEAGGPSEAATAVQQMFNQLIAKTGKIQSGSAFAGRTKVNVYEGGDTTGKTRNVRNVLEDVISGTGGRADELLKIFDVRGSKAVAGLATAYKTANIGAGGGEKGDKAGRAAIQAMLADAIDSTGTYADVQKDVALAMQDDSIKLSKAFQEVEQALGGAFTPAVVKLGTVLKENTPTIKAFADAMANVASYLIENPFKGLGSIIALKVIADLAAAAIGQRVAAAMVTSLAASSAGSALSAAAGGAAATGGAAAAATGGAAVARFGAAGLAGVLGYNAAIQGLQAIDTTDGRELSIGNAIDDLKEAGKRKFQWKNVADVFGGPSNKVSDILGEEIKPVNATTGKTMQTTVSDEAAAKIGAAVGEAVASQLNRSDSPTKPR